MDKDDKQIIIPMDTSKITISQPTYQEVWEEESIDLTTDVDFDINFPDPAFTGSVSSGYTISLNLEPEEVKSPPAQRDMFRHYITSQWLHSSHLSDEDPQWQCEAWIKSNPHLSEAQYQGNLEVVHTSSDSIDYFFSGTPEEWCVFRIKWSEFF